MAKVNAGPRQIEHRGAAAIVLDEEQRPNAEVGSAVGVYPGMHFYNHHRSHGALGWATPMATLNRLRGVNVPAQHT